MKRIHPKKLQPSPSRDSEFFLNVTSTEPHPITQNEISDLIIDLDLSRNKPKLLSSGLQQCYLLEDTVQVTEFRSLQKHFEQFFVTQGELNVFKTSRVSNEHPEQAVRMATIHRLFHAWPKSSVVAPVKLIVLNPCSYTVYKKETCKKKKQENFQLHALEDMLMAHLP